MTSTTLDFAGAQIAGKRAYQEDAFAFRDRTGDGAGLVCLLADGMGGHAAGDVAAQLSISVFAEELEGLSSPLHGQFMRALDQANRAISRTAKDDPDKAGMGCTFVAAEITDGQCHWISIGDSPLFYVSGTSIRRINADHSMAVQLDAAAERGEITREEAANSSSRNVLLSALTGDPITRVDQSKSGQVLAPGDWIILASDGIETLTPDEIVNIISGRPNANAEEVCASLLEAVEARDRSGQDNATVLAVRISTGNTAPDSDEVITRPVRTPRPGTP